MRVTLEALEARRREWEDWDDESDEVSQKEWPTCDSLPRMLPYLFAGVGGCRKPLLFLVACARRALPLISADVRRPYATALKTIAARACGAADEAAFERSVRPAVEDFTRRYWPTFTEMEDDDSDTAAIFGMCMIRHTMSAVCGAAEAARWWPDRVPPWRPGDEPVSEGFLGPLSRVAGSVRAAMCCKAHAEEDTPAWGRVERREERRQCNLVREIVGNPFRPVRVHPEWLTRNNGAVAVIARSIDEGARGLHPLLADALEDAGCSDQAVLRHCRERGRHVRGCWAVDLLLGKG
jgi:hypothetical protein